MVYSIADQRLVATGSGRPSERVHITIVPRKGAAKPRSVAGPGAAR